MNTKYTQRLSYVDAESRGRLLQACSDSIHNRLQTIRNDPGRLLQTRYAMMVSAYQDSGGVFYALGYPLEIVRKALALAGFAGLRVAELRGTQVPFRTLEVTLDASGATRGVDQLIQQPGKMDYSLGNSFENFVAVVTALTAGEVGIARRLAALAWDPPDAAWVGPRSFCTFNDQHAARALQCLFAGATDDALDVLAQIRPTKQRKVNTMASVDTPKAVTMLRALAIADAGLFLEGLRDLIRWHEITAMKSENQDDPGFYLSLPGTGLTILALYRGLIVSEQLPLNNPFLPVDLIELSRRFIREDVEMEFETLL